MSNVGNRERASVQRRGNVTPTPRVLQFRTERLRASTCAGQRRRHRRDNWVARTASGVGRKPRMWPSMSSGRPPSRSTPGDSNFTFTVPSAVRFFMESAGLRQEARR
jgi:hypothetical protein